MYLYLRIYGWGQVSVRTCPGQVFKINISKTCPGQVSRKRKMQETAYIAPIQVLRAFGS